VHLEAGLDGPSVTLLLGPFVPSEDVAARRALDRLVDEVRLVDDGGEAWVELIVSSSGPAGGP
jgi:hypothetical protein